MRLTLLHSRYQAAAELAAAEPETRGSVVQELYMPARQPDGSHSLSAGLMAKRTEIDNSSSRSMPPYRPFAISSENGNRRIFSEKHYHMEMEWQLLCFSPPMKKPFLSKLLRVRRSDDGRRGNAWIPSTNR